MGMNKNFLPALLALAVLSNRAVAADAPQPGSCALKQYASIDLVVLDSDVWLPVTIDGRSGLMALNTGSGLSVIWKDVALDLKLRRRELRPIRGSIRFGKQIVTEAAAFKSLSVDKVGFGKGEFLVVQRSQNETDPPGALGAIGLDVLAAVDFELDLAHKKLNLFSPEHCPGNVVYWTDTFASTPLLRGPLGNFYFAVELDDQKVEASIATGRQTTTLGTDVSKLMYGFDQDSPGIELSQDPDTGESQAHFRAMHINAPGLTVRNTRVRLISRPRACQIRRKSYESKAAGYGESCSGSFPLQLGRNVLQNLRLYFATKERVLYYSGAQASHTKNDSSPPAAAQ